MHDIGLVGPEDAECADVGGCLRDDDVTRVDEDAGHQVERLLGPGGDDDVVGVGVDPFERHDVEDLLAQGLVALAGAVLECLQAAGG